MSLPNVDVYGIVDNPLKFSPFVSGTSSLSPFSNMDMLFMDAQLWKLMTGEQLISMNS